jgi:hypothetical protein
MKERDAMKANLSNATIIACGDMGLLAFDRTLVCDGIVSRFNSSITTSRAIDVLHHSATKESGKVCGVKPVQYAQETPL